MFNPSPVRFLHVDLNSCFASIEQQANPLLRGKPLVVAAYTSPGGCILAASREAKKLGIKTGMRVFEGLRIYPRLIVLDPDPNKYRFVSGKLLEVFQKYTDKAEMRSIDEAILDFSSFQSNVIPGKDPGSSQDTDTRLDSGSEAGMIKNLWETALQIKKDIKSEIGEWLTVSVGISTNSYLSKLAAGLQKPDGLVEINCQNIESIFSKLKLDNLPYIKQGNSLRLNLVGIYTPLDFLNADGPTLKIAFRSIVGYRWHQWLHGYEIEGVSYDGRFPGEIDKTIGHSYALTRPSDDDSYLASLLCQLVEKMGRRLRAKNFVTTGMHVSCNLEDHRYWHHGEKLHAQLYGDGELYLAAWNILKRRPRGVAVTLLAVNSFNLEPADVVQESFFADTYSQRKLALAVDTINNRWGERSITLALTLETKGKIRDRVAFGKVNGSAV